MTFGLLNLIEFRDRAIRSFNALPTRFRFKGMDRDLTEQERVSFAQLDAAILTLQAFDPTVVNLDALKSSLGESAIIVHQYRSVFDE